jgi:hypothetical protein
MQAYLRDNAIYSGAEATECDMSAQERSIPTNEKKTTNRARKIFRRVDNEITGTPPY